MHYTFTQKCKKIFTIALPSGANSLLDTLNLLVSWYFVSQISTHHIVALGVSLNYIMILFAITTIFFVGTSAQVARFYGARDFKAMNEIVGTSTISVLLISVPVVIVFFAFIESYFEWMGKGVSTQAHELGAQYLSITLLYIPALLLKTIFIAALSGIGDTKCIMYIKTFTTTLNVILNIILINGLELGSFELGGFGIIGAALSSLIVMFVEASLLFWFIVFNNTKLKIFWVFKLGFFKQMLNIGIPAGIERFLTIFSLILTQKFVSSYGLDTIAGFQIGSKVESFILMPGFGFQVAAMVLVGQSLGRGQIKLAYGFIKTLLLIASCVMGILGLVICVFAMELASIFSNQSSVLQNSFYYILAVGLSQIPLIWIFCLDGALRGGGATKLSLLLNVCSIWFLRIIPMYLCVYFEQNVIFLFLIIFLETYLRACFFACMFKYRIWEKFITRF